MFRLGQRVVCINAEPHACLTKGAVYTVSRLHPEGISVEEIPGRASQGYFFRRFRPIVEKKTDISIFIKMLTDTNALECV